MCGICGIYNYKRTVRIDRQLIYNMTISLQHRGPDDEGYYFSPNIALGFRRLAILDLTPSGHQPMSNDDSSVQVIFNGEIYNYPELKKELQSYGFVFKSTSDTEVIVRGYEKWGDDVLNHLNGMFGLAIWDTKMEKLVLARDRMGIKPVYYSYSPEGIIFGSEIKSVIIGLGYIPDVDVGSLNLFLNYRFTPSPYTIYSGIFKLAPGEKITLRKNKSAIKEIWWKYSPPLPNKNITFKEAEKTLEYLYRESIGRHLVSDVPVGLLLSGGIDSAYLLHLMNRTDKHWPTFTVGYGRSYKDDELHLAAKTAQTLNSKHNEVMITRSDFENVLPEVIQCLEEPIASSSIVPMYYICKKAKEQVTVALIGQGPDELFGGYLRHLGIYYGHLWRSIPSGIRLRLKNAINDLSSNETLNRALYSLDLDDRETRYKRTFSLLPPGFSNNLFHKEYIDQVIQDLLEKSWSIYENLNKNTDELRGFQFYEMRSTLPDELLMYSDKLSMAHSLELRVPYLDKEIVEWAETLPDSMSIRLLKRKYIHRKVCAGNLPSEILRRSKKGFGVTVVDDWFDQATNSKMNAYLKDPDSLIYNYFQYEKIQDLYQSHINNDRNYHKILFSLVVFEEWLNQSSRIGVKV